MFGMSDMITIMYGKVKIYIAKLAACYPKPNNVSQVTSYSKPHTVSQHTAPSTLFSRHGYALMHFIKSCRVSTQPNFHNYTCEMGGKVVNDGFNSDEYYSDLIIWIMNTYLVLTSVVNFIFVKAFSNFSHSFKAF